MNGRGGDYNPAVTLIYTFIVHGAVSYASIFMQDGRSQRRQFHLESQLHKEITRKCKCLLAVDIKVEQCFEPSEDIVLYEGYLYANTQHVLESATTSLETWVSSRPTVSLDSSEVKVKSFLIFTALKGE